MTRFRPESCDRLSLFPQSRPLSRPRKSTRPSRRGGRRLRIRGSLSALLVAASLAMAGCPAQEVEDSTRPAPGTLDDAVARDASVGPFGPQKALVITDNDAAFASKLRMVESARSSIDMLYFVYWDDYTSAILTEALLQAIARGVEVRLLLDYDANYKDLDFFTALEDEARSAAGSLEIRFYNRPTRQIIRDAMFITMGCSEVGGGEAEACDERKFEVIDRAFSEEGIPPEKNVSNLNLANSGLFLSGWYTKNLKVMALAVTQGQEIDFESMAGSSGSSGETLEGVQKLARIYWRSKNGPAFQRVVNKLKLALIYLTHRSQVEGLRDTLTSLLPVREWQANREWRDWEYFTDFFHQKLLLVDGTKAQLGGRNIGDPYHMRPGPLLEDKYYFSDTDIYLELSGEDGEALRGVYDRLWSFDRMNATSAEIRQHAPNDLVANLSVLEAAEESCASVAADEREDCTDRAFTAGALSVEERKAARLRGMREKAGKYRASYAETPPLSSLPPTLEIDGEARLVYLENLPFLKDLPRAERTRLYGASGIEEEDDGKYIHHLWRLELENACAVATAESPRRIFVHNAYYLPPANLLRTVGKMVSGELDCRHVTVQVLTNSAETTDFAILNPLAYHGLKAFADFYRDGSDPEKRARFEFYEYLKNPEIPTFSLHSKVTVLGDDVLIGSANAEVRSYMKDSNNAVLIRNAPRFRERYTEIMDRLIADPEVTRDLGESLAARSREDMKEEHLQLVRGLLDSKFSGLSEQHRATVEELLLKILDAVYDLTLAVLRGDEEALDRYNRLFRLL